jgi:alpha-galactosidase
LTVSLSDLAERAFIQVDLEIYAEQPVLRYRTRFTNRQARRVFVQAADMLPWNLETRGESLTTFRVNQWVKSGQLGNFDPLEGPLADDGTAWAVESGASGQHCGWLALRDGHDEGLFAGWEFDGRASAALQQFGPAGYAALSARIDRLNQPLDQGQEFDVPWAFIGLFKGDWDDAGWQTQRLVEAVLARPVPEPERFPYVIWDSWKYQTAIDEATLRRNADLAAQLGIEVFVIDLGWARQIGDWREDSRKFPSGLKALSDYVHSLGMKFGLHFAFAEAMADSPVLRANPDWASSQSYGYFDARSLCLSHTPVREWLVNEALRMIDDYGVDWIVQDGENMVKQCTRTTHTHDPNNSNYANSVLGLNVVVAEIQRQRPGVLWENCEDGGNMMTFNMVKNYVTSINSDDSGALTTRQAVYGATYPFPLRYTDRYMPHEELDRYTTRSYMFGGPWIFMNRLPEMAPHDLELAAREISVYKRIRRQLRESRVYHLTGRPEEGAWDALQALHPETGRSIAFVVRDGARAEVFNLKPRGLDQDALYRVTFEDNDRGFLRTGGQLQTQGLPVRVESGWDAAIVYLNPVRE